MKWFYYTCESESCSVMSDSLQPHGLYNPWNSLGQNTGVGSLSLLQGIFPTQWSSRGLPHCRWILYQLSHKRSYTYTYILFSYPFPKTHFSFAILKHESQPIWGCWVFISRFPLAAFLWFVDIWNHEWHTQHSFMLFLLRNNLLGSFFTAPLLYVSE